MTFEIILPLICFLLDPLTNKHCQAWRSMNIYVDRLKDLSKVGQSKAKVTLTMLYLNILYDMFSQHY